MYSDFRNYNQLLNKIYDTSYCTVALIDIDHFVEVCKNESYPTVISKIKDFLQKHLHHEVLYLGKDEFAIISYEKRTSAGTLIVELSQISFPFNELMKTSFSAAIGEFPTHAEDNIEFVRLLEESLHHSKEISRDRISFVSESKMKMKSNYYTLPQLKRLSQLSHRLDRSEASLLREALDTILRKYED